MPRTYAASFQPVSPSAPSSACLARSYAASHAALRTVKGVGQKQLAEKLSISYKTVSHWETGYSEPSIAQLIQLADFFEVSIDDLVDRNNDTCI